MTVGEALRHKLGYPVSNGAIELACIDNGLVYDARYEGKEKNFDLALADLLLIVLNAPNTSEGSFSISLSERTNIKAVRRSILEKYGMGDDTAPTINNVNVW